MAKTIRIKIYKFEELTPAAQTKALNQFADINTDYEWWDSTYEDAKTIGLLIKGFDTNVSVIGQFIAGAEETAHLIEKEHGPDTETFKTATLYLQSRDKLINEWPKDENQEHINVLELDWELDALDADFLRSLCEDYRIMLSKEYDYLTSEEAIKETVIANEYDFTKDGKQYY